MTYSRTRQHLRKFASASVRFCRSLMILLPIWAGLLAAAPANPQSSQPLSLDDFLDDWRVSTGVVGISAACQSPAHATAGASGVAGKSGAELTTDSILYAGSITKMMTALAVMRLVSSGDIGLDHPLKLWHSSYPNAERISVSNLLSMRSGTLDYFSASAESPLVGILLNDLSKRWSPEQLLDQIAPLAPTDQPGGSHHYSNTDYILLGTIVEAITDRPLGEDFEAHQFAPLGLRNTKLGSDNMPVVSGYLRGSAPLFGSNQPTWVEASALQGIESLAWSAGGVVSSANDLTLWMQGLFSGAIVDADTLTAMLNLEDPAADYAFGLRHFETSAGTAIGHDGTLPGFASLLVHFPERQLSVSVLSNDEGAEPYLIDLAAQISGQFCQ